MSTLSLPTQRSSTETTLEARFDALVRSADPALRRVQDGSREGADFETVFDLDYCQPVAHVPPSGFAPLTEESCAPRARRIRVTEPEPAPLTAPADGPVRLTRRGRAVLGLALLGLVLVGMTLMGGWATASLTGGAPEPVRVIQVAPGDTLYGIAGDLAEPGEVREMVHRIQELNSLPGAQISEGQKLAVPRG